MKELGRSTFGELLRRLRLGAGLSQEALAERARMSVQTIGSLERGARRAPYRETLALLAGALELSAESSAQLEAAGRRPQQPQLRLVPSGSEIARLHRTVQAHNLPAQASSLIGRDEAIAQISALVVAHRLVTLVGSGGVGKTRLALAVAESLLPRCPDGVWLVELAALEKPDLVIGAVAATLHVQESPKQSLLETLVVSLKSRRLLLVLDNCEHVLDEARRVALTILVECPCVQVLATSREPLGVAGEHPHRVPSLAYPERPIKSADEAAAYAAVQLFTQRARASGAPFQFGSENAASVADICRRLEGIPLAIELAASRARMLSPQQLLVMLEERFRVLTGGGRTALRRQQTLRATVEWSYELLLPQEQRLFERMAVFSGGCTLDVANDVCGNDAETRGDTFKTLSSLVNKSVVVADVDLPKCRYRLLETSREYARERLATRGESDVIARRHALAYLELAQRVENAFETEPDHVRRELAHGEIDNWRSALTWSLIKRGDVELGQRLAATNVICEVIPPLEGKQWIALALEQVTERTPESIAAGLALTNVRRSWDFSGYRDRLVLSEVALVRCRAGGDPMDIARAQTWVGIALTHLGRTDEGRALLQRTLQMARCSGSRRLALLILHGLVLCSTGAEAWAFARERLAIQKAFEDDQSVAMTLAWSIADLEARDGNVEMALQHTAEALETLRDRDRLNLAQLLGKMAAYHICLGQYDDAVVDARESLELSLEQQLEVSVGYALQHLGAVGSLRPQADACQAESDRRLARILGFVDARFAALHWTRAFIDQQEYDRLLTFLRSCLPHSALSDLMAEGAALTEAEAISEARLV